MPALSGGGGTASSTLPGISPSKCKAPHSTLRQVPPHQLFPFRVERQGRRGGAGAAVPVFGVRLVAFLAMQVGMDMRAISVVALLRALMRLVPVAPGIPPQRLQGERKP